MFLQNAQPIKCVIFNHDYYFYDNKIEKVEKGSAVWYDNGVIRLRCSNKLFHDIPIECLWNDLSLIETAISLLKYKKIKNI